MTASMACPAASPAARHLDDGAVNDPHDLGHTDVCGVAGDAVPAVGAALAVDEPRPAYLGQDAFEEARGDVALARHPVDGDRWRIGPREAGEHQQCTHGVVGFGGNPHAGRAVQFMADRGYQR